jgi:uncharacterized protein (TIGR03086 family)
MGAELLDRAYAATGAVLANVTPDQLDLGTPCVSWRVRDLLNHVIAGGYFFAAVATGEEPTPAADRPDYSAGDYHASFADGSAKALAAFRAEGAMAQIMKPPFGDVPGSVFVMIAAADVYTHGWDLARATGQRSELDPDVGEQLLAFAHGMMSDDFRGPDPTSAFGPPVEVPDDAPVADRLAGFLGRRP